eukprot:305378-Rhodomonas_salina.1
MVLSFTPVGGKDSCCTRIFSVSGRFSTQNRNRKFESRNCKFESCWYGKLLVPGTRVPGYPGTPGYIVLKWLGGSWWSVSVSEAYPGTRMKISDSVRRAWVFEFGSESLPLADSQLSYPVLCIASESKVDF